MKNQHLKIFGAVIGVLTLGAVAVYGRGVLALVAPPAPTISSLSPNSGPTAGGTSVTVDGSNFEANSSVTFGGLPATVVSSTPTQINVTTPAHVAGPVDVVATNSAGSATFTGGFTYIAPPPSGDACGKEDKKNKKVAVCHIPPGNAEEAHTLCLPDSAIPAHLAHGDYLGACVDSSHDDEHEGHDSSDKKGGR